MVNHHTIARKLDWSFVCVYFVYRQESPGDTPYIFQSKPARWMSTIDLIEKFLDHGFVQFERVWRIMPWDMACTNHGFVPPRDNKENLGGGCVHRLARQPDSHIGPNLIYDHIHRDRCRILRTKS